jgi:hypothetical protein
MSLLDGEVGELQVITTDDCLNFFKQMCVTAREFQKLNTKTVTASAKTSRDENRIRARHGATVVRVTDWWKGLKGAVGCHETEDATSPGCIMCICDVAQHAWLLLNASGMRAHRLHSNQRHRSRVLSTSPSRVVIS